MRLTLKKRDVYTRVGVLLIKKGDIYIFLNMYIIRYAKTVLYCGSWVKFLRIRNLQKAHKLIAPNLTFQ